jgi:hypothetical protein
MLSLQVIPEYVVPGLTILLEAAETPPNFASAERLLRNILSAIAAVGCALSAAFSYLDVLRWNRREQGIYGLSPPALMSALVPGGGNSCFKRRHDRPKSGKYHYFLKG